MLARDYYSDFPLSTSSQIRSTGSMSGLFQAAQAANDVMKMGSGLVDSVQVGKNLAWPAGILDNSPSLIDWVDSRVPLGQRDGFNRRWRRVSLIRRRFAL